MIVRSLIGLSLLTLASCAMSDMYPSGTTDTGSLNQTGVILTGSMGLDNTGGVDHQFPLVEDLAGIGNSYYPMFQWLGTKHISIKHTAWIETRILFMNEQATSMHVVITFPSRTLSGNLRLSQIVMPDGTMDGPFGTDSTIQLAQSGGYELRFHENMMSGDPWSWEADIAITLLRK